MGVICYSVRVEHAGVIAVPQCREYRHFHVLGCHAALEHIVVLAVGGNGCEVLYIYDLMFVFRAGLGNLELHIGIFARSHLV